MYIFAESGNVDDAWPLSSIRSQLGVERKVNAGGVLNPKDRDKSDAFIKKSKLLYNDGLDVSVWQDSPYFPLEGLSFYQPIVLQSLLKVKGRRRISEAQLRRKGDGHQKLKIEEKCVKSTRFHCQK